MNKLEQDTRLEGGNGHYTSKLQEEWQVWSPNGGYMAAMALRAVGLESRFSRPLSMACNFLSVGTFDEVQIEVRSLKRSRVAEPLQVSMRQGERHLLEATVWTGDEVDGYVHDDAPMPDVPTVEETLPLDQVISSPPPHPFWQLLEQRPLDLVHWEPEGEGPPVQRDWLRMRGEGPWSDPYISAGRSLVFLDNFGWPAAGHAHFGDQRFIAPTLSLFVNFHRHYEGDWIFSRAWSPVAERGLISFDNRLWSPDGLALASGSGTLLCRPRPGQ